MGDDVIEADLFEIQRSRVGDRILLQVRGDLDMVTLPDFGVSLAEARAEATGDVLIDLTEVPFFDAMTLGQLAVTASAVAESGHRVCLRGLSDFQQRVVRICHLDELLETG